MTDYLSGKSTAPGRPRKFLKSPESGRLPFSCTLVVHKSVTEVLAFVARSLKAAAGVKTIYDKDFQLDEAAATPGNLYLHCDESHPDYTAFKALNYNYMLPADVAILKVQDSMESEGGTGIIDSWEVVWRNISRGIDIAVDLSALRPAGTINSTQLEASGPASFAEIYIAMAEYAADVSVLNLLKLMGVLNDVIMRGGFKRGIVTSMMDIRCPHFKDYMNAPIGELRGSHKKGAIVYEDYLTTELEELIVAKLASESIFLEKGTDDGLYSNVCVGIKLADRATCLIWRVNLGQCTTRSSVIEAFEQSMTSLCDLHTSWRDHPNAAQNRGIWAELENDRQVALDVMGLSNLLHKFGYKYEDFIADLERFVEEPYTANGIVEEVLSEDSAMLIEWIYAGYLAALNTADVNMESKGLPKLDRLFTVEPAQSHSFETVDTQGYTTARGIWPPMNRLTNRVSDVQEDVLVDYGTEETVATVGPENIFRLNNAWQKLMDHTNRAHAISMDTYEKPSVEWLGKWLRSDLKTVYYNFSSKFDQSFAAKSAVELDGWDDEPVCSVCAQ